MQTLNIILILTICLSITYLTTCTYFRITEADCPKSSGMTWNEYGYENVGKQCTDHHDRVLRLPKDGKCKRHREATHTWRLKSWRTDSNSVSVTNSTRYWNTKLVGLEAPCPTSNHRSIRTFLSTVACLLTETAWANEKGNWTTVGKWHKVGVSGEPTWWGLS